MNEEDLKYLDDILMRDADTLVNETFVEDVLAVESLEKSDEDYTDIDTLVCEEGFIAKTRSAIFGKREQRQKEIEAEEERKKLQDRSTQIDNFIREKKRELLADIQRRTADFKNLNFNNKREMLWNEFGKCQSKINSANFIPNRDEVIRSDNWDNEMRSIVINSQSQLKKSVQEFHELCDTTLEACKKLEAEYEKSRRDGQKKDRSQIRNEKPRPVVQGALTEGLSNVDVAVLVTLGAALFGKVIAHKVDKKDMGVFRSNREARPYYYLLSNEFKKSEKSLKSLLKRNKKFITSKVVLEEIVNFRKKYYNRVAMTVNRFMEVFESMESLVGKEKDYTFPDDNPVRDAAITSKLHQRCLKFYELRHSNFTHSAAEVLVYEPSYVNSDDMGKILVDSKYLTELLRPDETFRCINVLENIIKKIPSIDDANRYEELLINVKGEAGPLRMYTSTMLDLRDTALEVRSILNAYINVVYAILDFSVLANENYNANQGTDVATEAAIRIKDKYFNYTKLTATVLILKRRFPKSIDSDEDAEKIKKILEGDPYDRGISFRLFTSDISALLDTDINTSKKRMEVINETKKCLAECTQIDDYLSKNKYFNILDCGVYDCYVDLVDELNFGLKCLLEGRTYGKSIVVDSVGCKLIHEFNILTMNAVKMYTEYMNNKENGYTVNGIERDLDCKKLGMFLLTLKSKDPSDFSYKKFSELYSQSILRDRLTNLIKSYPGEYFGDKKKEIIECTKAAIEICEKYERYAVEVYNPHIVNFTDEFFATDWSQQLKIGLNKELGRDFEPSWPYNDDDPGVVVDKKALVILSKIIKIFYEYTNKNKQVLESVLMKYKKDPSFKKEWYKSNSPYFDPDIAWEFI